MWESWPSLDEELKSKKSLAEITAILDKGHHTRKNNRSHPRRWSGSNPLHQAVYYKRKDIVSLLLDRGVDIDEVNTRGQFKCTALIAAVENGSTDIVSLLLDRGASISKEVDKYGTALTVAAHRGKMDIISLLLDRGANINQVDRVQGTALAVAAARGKMDVVLLLLDQGADVNTADGNFGTALANAVSQGKMESVSLLLDRGADVNMMCGMHGTALITAVYKGGRSIVSLLLDRGANINQAGGKYGTALATAAFKRNMDIVLLLLDRGANVNEVGGEYGTALATAASIKNNDTLSLLLDRGANINQECGRDCGTALAVAAFYGNEDYVSLLLDRGASDNMVDRRYMSALACAAFKGRVAIISLLLDRGVDVDTVGGIYGSALAAAAFMGEIPTVALLLLRGANIIQGGEEYGTPLAAAAWGGGTDAVFMLLDRGVDPNIEGGKHGTALAEAASCGRKDIVSLLLDRGADVNMVCGVHGTALATAAYTGEKSIVSLLLRRGANINQEGGESGTALAAAAFQGKLQIVSLLLGRGADVNTVCGVYGTALAAAAYKGERSIVSLLLKRGANINQVGGEYGTALAAAASQGEIDTVSLLLDKGADVNMVGGMHGTAMAAAAYSGERSIVSLLLDRGANINQVGGKYGTVLAAAAAGWSPHPALLLLDRGADINMVVDEYATALLAAAAFEGITHLVSLLLDRGTDVNMVCSKYGTALAAAISGGRTDIASLLLERGANRADVTRVCGSYSTAIEKPAIEKQTGPRHQLVYPDDNEISWPPFPMPYTGQNHHNVTLSLLSSLSSLDILSTEFCAGGNLTPGQADVPCPKLKEEVLWNSLAALVGLHNDITLAKHQWIRYDLCFFVAHNFDLGLAYAAARVAWKYFEHSNNSMDPSVIFTRRSRWHRYAQVLEEAQSKVIEIESNQVKSTGGGKTTNRSSSVKIQQELIISPYSVMPRRLWDLKSNRVVDFRMLHAAQPTIETRPTFWAVTHSWTSDMTPVSTAINQFQWPVPLPKGISLESLRSELLTLGAEYVWLDVICLRQRSELNSLEQLRQKEWKLDVPTIGNIYRAAAKIVRYFNGLGVPFSNEGWDSSRHWLQRAWTLQEIASEKNTINGSIPRDRSQRWVFLNSKGKVSGKLIKFRSAIGPVIQLAAQVDSQYGCEIYELAREMARRQSTELVDKISGLFYLLRTTKLPCYDEHKTSEDIWRESFHLLPLAQRAEILFDFPYRGSDAQWFPTWAQVLDWPTRDPEYNHMRPHISHDLARNALGEISFIRNIWTIPGVTLSERNYPGECEYGVETNGRLFGFYPPYLKQKPIDIQDSVFTLATLDIGYAYNWVVCKAIGKKAGESVGFDGVAEVNVLRKIGVLRTDACSELMVGGQNGSSLLQQMDCLFV